MTPSSEKEYLVFCDESDRRGKFYSNFYGGVRVAASTLKSVEEALAQEKARLGLTSEIKWEKVGPGVVDRYEAFIRVFFEQIRSRRVVMRVMFTQNARVATGLDAAQISDSYYLLYYQFLKHGFGFGHMPLHSSAPRLRIYLDEIGDTKEQVAKFKGYLLALPDTKAIRQAGGLLLEQSAITEVRSHDHIVMQALDVVLGSITFRLNNKHVEKPPGSRFRGKRTVAKERLYRSILEQIKSVTGKKGFNIGITTGLSDCEDARWSDAYLHWLFIPQNHLIEQGAFKP